MKDILLPQPEKDGGITLREALCLRRSSRSYSTRQIPLQQLSNVLWAGWGFSHGGDNQLRTAPSSHNRQEMDLYVFMASGTYIYEAAGCLLRQVNGDDLRETTAEQEYAFKAPVQVALISDTSKIKGKTPQGVIESIYANAGFISENIYLAAAAEGLATVARAMVPKEMLHQRMGLRPEQVITLVHTLGYFEK